MSEQEIGLDRRIARGTELVRGQVDYFRRSFASVASERKKDASLVTEADHSISKWILEGIAEDFERDDLCSEESESGEQLLESQFCWVIDPVDGTNNFAIGLPNCAISLALLRNGCPVYGWVYDFAGDRLIHGGAGRGLFEGDAPLQPRQVEENDSTPVGLQFPVPPGVVDKFIPLLETERVRSIGSGTMEGVYAALGCLQGVVDFRVKVWDIAAFIAFFDELGVEYRFLEESPFPLRTFSPDMKATPYLAGAGFYCRRVEKLLEGGDAVQRRS